MEYCEICAKEVTMEIVWIQSRDNEKKKRICYEEIALMHISWLLNRTLK